MYPSHMEPMMSTIYKACCKIMEEQPQTHQEDIVVHNVHLKQYKQGEKYD
jgi:hypothetical protein